VEAKKEQTMDAFKTKCWMQDHAIEFTDESGCNIEEMINRARHALNITSTHNIVQFLLEDIATNVGIHAEIEFDKSR
jgi:hypothetical protein